MDDQNIKVQKAFLPKKQTFFHVEFFIPLSVLNTLIQTFLQSFLQWIQTFSQGLFRKTSMVPRVTASMGMACIILGGCVKQPPCQDKEVCKTKEQFLQLNSPPCKTSKTVVEETTIHCSELPKPLLQKVSLSLSGRIPLDEAFYELARQTQINIVLDGNLKRSKRILYHAKDQRLADLLDNLCAVAGLRYRFCNNTLHVCRDTPYMKTHGVQFLLGARQTKTQTSVKTDIFVSGGQEKTSGRENGANIALNSSNTTDFWDELEKNLQIILETRGKNPPPGTAYFSMNRYGGILSVFGTEKQHRMVAEYLCRLKKLVTTQVLIEAKIIEVDLIDEYRGGINWNAFFMDKRLRNSLMPQAPLLRAGRTGSIVGAAASRNAGDAFTFHVENAYLSAMATFMEKFGTVRTLANPRITVLNNQPAILKVARNEVFFELRVEDIVSGGTTPVIQKAESHIQTVPIGLILYVQPSVNLETGEIFLSLHPTISRVVGMRPDPAVVMNQERSNRNTISEIPVVQVREMDSIIVARENQVIVTGGLMEEHTSNDKKDVPYLSDIPIIGNLFQFKEKKTRVTELVILLKLSIVPQSTDTLDPADQRLYKEFTKDPRPF